MFAPLGFVVLFLSWNFPKQRGGKNPVPATTNPFRNERVFFCSKLKYTEDLRVYWLSVKQLIFLTFYLKTNKVKNQIYTKLTVKTAETDSNIDSKKSKKSPQKFYKPQPPI